MKSIDAAVRTQPSLFWRLLPSYLLVIAVSALTALIAGEVFAPYLLERHVTGMMESMRGGSTAMTLGMAEDLNGAYRRALTQSLLWASGVSMLVATMAGYYLTRRIVTPLRALRSASSRIAKGDYGARLSSKAPGELGDLAHAFNKMAVELENSEKQRVSLLADVAHEFRTPLSNLKGYVEGLEDGVFPADTSTLAACGRQIRRLERLTDDLSLLSRVETGQLHLRQEEVGVESILQRASEAFRPRFESRQIEMRLTMVPEQVVVVADEERTIQVLSNLLVNALKFTPAGGEVSVAAAPESGDSVRFEVTNSGPGVDPQDVPHLFKRFYRGSRSQREDGGTGIGLTLVKQLVERQGGKVGVESNASGTTFWFTLPIARQLPDDGASATPDTSRVGHGNRNRT